MNMGKKKERCVHFSRLPGPVDGPVAEGVNAIGEGVAFAGVRVPARKHYRLQATVQLWQRHLEAHSHPIRTQSKGSSLLDQQV